MKDMGEKKQSNALGWIGVIVIIVGLIGAVFVFMPDESETEQNNNEKIEPPKARNEPIDDNLNPITIQKIKNEFPILLEQQKKNLRDCQNIDSFQDYLDSTSRLGSKTMEETIEEYENNHSMVFWDLSNKGYDKHPEIKSLFQETEKTSRDVLYCLDDIYLRYDPEFLK